MKEKKIIPCIYLCNKIAVKGLQDRTLVDADPLSLAKFYENNGADALLIFDMSDSDESHEEALDIIKSICMELDIPVYGAGNVKRMEDIKKIEEVGDFIINIKNGARKRILMKQYVLFGTNVFVHILVHV